MNLDYYIKRKHIFKKRQNYNIVIKPLNISNYSCIYTAKFFKIEFVYIRLFKKLFRRKFIKATTRFFKPIFWLKLIPNYLLTQKSKNSRMGAGVGKFVRLVNYTKPGKSIIKTWHYTDYYLKSTIKYMHYKINNKFLLKNVKNK